MRTYDRNTVYSQVFTVCTFILSVSLSLKRTTSPLHTLSLLSKLVLKHTHRDPAADASGRPIAVRSRCLVKLQLRPATRWVGMAVAGTVCARGSVIDWLHHPLRCWPAIVSLPSLYSFFAIADLVSLGVCLPPLVLARLAMRYFACPGSWASFFPPSSSGFGVWAPPLDSPM